jgi:ferredoxin/menaquinone-dependent protoporphyrinogen IX oxidase
MKFNKICTYYYSPTGTTQTIVEKIAEGTGAQPIDVISNNITYPEWQESLVEPGKGDLVIIGAPVYAGRIAITAIERLEKINFSENPVVLVAVYGNRDYDDSLVELKEFAAKNELRPLAAGAFIGEHSYSTSRDPIGHGRPDANDKELAHDFGRKIIEKLEKLNEESGISELEVPGTFPLPDRKVLPPVFAETVQERCIKCGICQTVCPTGAVYFKKGYHTHENLCTLCCACIKACKQNARVVKSDHLRKVREWLLSICTTRREPETFF